MPGKITLSALDLTDMTVAELSTLGDELSTAAGLPYEVDGASPSGDQMSLVDTLIIVLPTADLLKELVYGELKDALVRFMKRRHKEIPGRDALIIIKIENDNGDQTVRIEIPTDGLSRDD